MKKIIKTLKNITKILQGSWRTALTAVAAFAIANYVFPLLGITNQWWALMLTAAVIGLLAWLLSPLMVNFKIVNTIIPFGFTLLILDSFKSFFSNLLFIKILGTMIFISIIIELINQKGKEDTYWISFFKNLIIDILIILLSARIISYIKIPVVTISVLLIAYACILCLDIDFSLNIHFDLKAKKNKT